MRDGIDQVDRRVSPPFIGVAEFTIRGWDVILPGWRWLYEPRVGVSTPCGAVSTRGYNVFTPGLLEL